MTTDVEATNDWWKRPFWLTVTAAGGYLLYRSAEAFARIWQRPRLKVAVPPDQLAEGDTIDTAAYVIASSDVINCIEERTVPDGQTFRLLNAGWRHFREPWARDFGFAVFGLMALEENTAVHDGLALFLAHQRPSGQFPVKVHGTNILERYLHALLHREQPIDKPIEPKYRTGHQTISLDGNCLLTIAGLHYALQTDSRDFLAAHWPQWQQAIRWVTEQGALADGLLAQSAYGDWADSVSRRGRVLYPNVLYWQALVMLGKAAAYLGETAVAAHYTAQADALKNSIQRFFWREELGYFITSNRFNNLSADGNLLAIVWGLATPAQANAILEAMQRRSMAMPVPTKAAVPGYTRGAIALENRLAGIAHYHTAAAWMWLGGWHVIALSRAGRHAEADAMLHRMSEIIVRDGVVHEVYDRDGRPLRTMLYHSEAPLTWSAAMYIYAHQTVYHQA